MYGSKNVKFIKNYCEGHTYCKQPDLTRKRYEALTPISGLRL